MKVVFFSNYLSPHQLPFCEEMYKRLKNNYHFVSCEPYDESRIKLGWSNCEGRPYEIKIFDNELKYKEAMQLVEDADIMIWGSASFEFIKKRLKINKIIFRYSESLLKKGFLISLFNLDYFRFIKFNLLTRSNKCYLLSASMYAPYDFKLTCAKFAKEYKWGYFPKFINQNIDGFINRRNKNVNKISLLWAGRLITWKHPEYIIQLTEFLMLNKYDFEIKVIGTGELEKKFVSEIENKGLKKYINFLGALDTEEVRKYMEQSDIFIFTSDYNEGWGAVLNEAMNSLCSVVCSDAIGSSGYLIENFKNGLLYKNGDFNDFVEKVVYLMEHQNIRHTMGMEAYKTISNNWTPEIATQRFLELCEGILNNKYVEFEKGVLSEAKIIKRKHRGIL